MSNGYVGINQIGNLVNSLNLFEPIFLPSSLYSTYHPNMHTALGGSVQKASEAITGAMSSNKKVADMKKQHNAPNERTHLTTDTGYKAPTHDLWLSASTGDNKGPALLEDNIAREKVSIFSYHRIANTY